MSRTEAKSSLDVKEYSAQMTGIYSTCVSRATLDESPMAYKNADAIKKYIEPTAEIIEQIKPVYNFKASD